MLFRAFALFTGSALILQCTACILAGWQRAGRMLASISARRRTDVGPTSVRCWLIIGNTSTKRTRDRPIIGWRRRPDVGWPTVGQYVGGGCKTTVCRRGQPASARRRPYRPPDVGPTSAQCRTVNWVSAYENFCLRLWRAETIVDFF